MARKILLADDSVTAQNMGRKILADAGYEVITVNNGSAALKKIAEQKPDLIVLDVYMPGYSGLEVCQRLKEVGETARIPILLTVGKLEPFKTDEAKRVRADGFIVKPFEASELLSALSKLEDKIVPRAEGSKPGRFARATAAIEEGRDRTVSGDEDSGWKSRIAFPSKKKKEAAPEPDVEDPAIYNAVNKDLRTVVEHHAPIEAAKVEPAAKAEATKRVDVGALASEGLPKDVTPEEIAAIAAAAAQMQGKVLESKADEQREAAVEAKAEEQSAPVALTQSEPVAEPIAASATFAEQVSPVPTESAPIPEPAVTSAQISAPAVSEEPVTMAAAAGVHSTGSTVHWTAVAIALAPEESGISLEQEMQKAYAEFAATQTETSLPVPPAMEPVASAAPVPVSEPAVEETPSMSAAVAPPPVEEVASVANSAGESFTAAIKEFETVAPPAEPVETSAATWSESPAVAPEPEPVPVAESKEEPVTAAEIASSEIASPVAESSAPETVAHEPQEEQLAAEPVPVAAAPEVVSEPASELTTPVEAAPVAASEPEVKSEAVADHKESDHKDSDISATTAAAWATWRKIRESGDGHKDHGEPEKSAEDAAMAVAAGAEKGPEESDNGSDPEISSIVDSVLADLRPKIVEEISRKLGKKK